MKHCSARSIIDDAAWDALAMDYGLGPKPLFKWSKPTRLASMLASNPHRGPDCFDIMDTIVGKSFPNCSYKNAQRISLVSQANVATIQGHSGLVPSFINGIMLPAFADVNNSTKGGFVC